MHAAQHPAPSRPSETKGECRGLCLVWFPSRHSPSFTHYRYRCRETRALARRGQVSLARRLVELTTISPQARRISVPRSVLRQPPSDHAHLSSCVVPLTLTFFSPLSQVIDDERGATASTGLAYAISRKSTYSRPPSRRSSSLCFGGWKFFALGVCRHHPSHRMPRDARARARPRPWARGSFEGRGALRSASAGRGRRQTFHRCRLTGSERRTHRGMSADDNLRGSCPGPRSGLLLGWLGGHHAKIRAV